MNLIAQFVRVRRKSLHLTQIQLAEKAGVGIRFIRDLEQGKESIRLDKANAVLAMFSHEAGPVEIPREGR
jgi:y4mF family transcriptional regulator